MARKVEFNKQYLLERTIDFIRKDGIGSLTARNLCRYIGWETGDILCKICGKRRSAWFKRLHAARKKHAFA